MPKHRHHRLLTAIPLAIGSKADAKVAEKKYTDLCKSRSKVALEFPFSAEVSALSHFQILKLAHCHSGTLSN